jgi:hypothetical protein
VLKQTDGGNHTYLSELHDQNIFTIHSSRYVLKILGHYEQRIIATSLMNNVYLVFICTQKSW